MTGPGDVERLLEALDTLPRIRRIVYLLSARDGLNHAEIAVRLKLSLSDVERHLADALVQLGTALQANRERDR